MDDDMGLGIRIVNLGRVVFLVVVFSVGVLFLPFKWEERVAGIFFGSELKIKGNESKIERSPRLLIGSETKRKTNERKLYTGTSLHRAIFQSFKKGEHGFNILMYF
jgi:hypothetical protein